MRNRVIRKERERDKEREKKRERERDKEREKKKREREREKRERDERALSYLMKSALQKIRNKNCTLLHYGKFNVTMNENINI